MHADTSVDDDVEMRLDRTLLDQHVPGRRVHLRGGVGHGREHAAGDAREEIQAMQSRHALDETERIVHEGRT
jgi:hypothetical protein